MYTFESLAWEQGYQTVCGVDEAGRGPLAGDVFAAAVILPPGKTLDGLRDSKKLSEKQRERLAPLIRQESLAWCVASASVEEIFELNILHAAMLAMRRAVDGLSIPPDYILVDGNQNPCFPLHIPIECLVKGDDRSASIAAASILAKVARDEEMVRLDALYPQYGLAKHKGYPTAEHKAAVRQYGVSPIHRKGFRLYNGYIPERWRKP